MNDDQQLEQLLRALGQTEPREDFSQRMTRKVESKLASPDSAKKPSVWIWVPVAATLMAGLSAAVLHRTTSPSPHAVAISGPESEGPRLALRMAPPAKRKTVHAVFPRHLLPEPPQKVEAEASFPAPPMPLTEQEKLLRRIAHTGDPQEFATLNAEARKKAEASQIEAYEAYFAPPPPSQDVLDTIKMQKEGDPQ